MMGFQTYMDEVRQQLECNCPEEKPNHVVFTFTTEQVEAERVYFLRCFRKNLSAYKALTFFIDHLNNPEPE